MTEHLDSKEFLQRAGDIQNISKKGLGKIHFKNATSPTVVLELVNKVERYTSRRDEWIHCRGASADRESIHLADS